jgi:hypothetical protein
VKKCESNKEKNMHTIEPGSERKHPFDTEGGDNPSPPSPPSPPPPPSNPPAEEPEYVDFSKKSNVDHSIG